MDLRYIENPCLIVELNNKKVDEFYYIEQTIKHGEEYCRDKQEYTAKKLMYENYKNFQKGYEAAVELLTAKRMKKLVPFLVYSLSPQFEPIPKGEYHPSKIGGIPDLRYALGIRSGKKKNELAEALKSIWPRCGCCHEKMKYLGGFDLFSWSMPIYVNTMFQFDQWSGSSAIGSKRFIEHRSIFANQIYNVFVCENAGQHWDNPNMDCHILMSNEPSQRVDGKDVFIDSETWIKAYHEAGFSDKDVLQNTPNRDMKITGYKLNFSVDFESYQSQLGDKKDYDIGDKYETLVEKNPSVLGDSYTDEFRLFGEPRCQQTPKRYMSTNSYPCPRRMTPFLSYNDDDCDMTYQLYFDLFCSDGYKAYGKCDASCT